MFIIIYCVTEMVTSLAFKLGYVFLTCPYFFFFFECFLVFWPNGILQTHLVLSQLQSWNEPFLQGALVFFSGRYLETKIWVPGVLRGLMASGSGF